MLSILRKSMANNNGGSSPTHRHDAVEDLAAWELVSPSLSDDEDHYSLDSDDIISDGDNDGEDVEDHKREANPRDISHLDDVISMQSLSVSPQPVVCFPVEDVMGLHVYDYDDDVEEGEENGGMEDDDDDDDVDDELIPWKLKDRFGKQRIRKMGKRGGPKVSKSKRLPHYHNRPGCLYGKHGLGVQHYYI